MSEKLNHYVVEIILKVGLLHDKVGSEYKENKISVLKQNEDRICLDNYYFTTILKGGKVYHGAVLNKPNISSYINDNCFGTRINYSLYSNKTKRKTTIKKEIAEYINEKIGCFNNKEIAEYINEKIGCFNNVDLSFLDDE